MNGQTQNPTNSIAGDLIAVSNAEVAAAREARLDRQNQRDIAREDRKTNALVAKIAGGAAVLVALISVLLPPLLEGDPTPPAPTPISCGPERDAAEAEYDRNGTWKELPETSPVEQQCDVNGHINDIKEHEPKPPPSTTS